MHRTNLIDSECSTLIDSECTTPIDSEPSCNHVAEMEELK